MFSRIRDYRSQLAKSTMANRSDNKIVCPECYKNGFSPQGGKSAYYKCHFCGYTLKCPYCGAIHSLELNIPKKSIECRVCGTNFWEEKLVGKPKKTVKTEPLCAYCGNEDPECPYCAKPSCSRCKTKNNVQIQDEVYHCYTCQTEFIYEKIVTPKLITEPETVRRLTKELLKYCPICKKTNIISTLNGMKCNHCSAEWSPGIGDEKSPISMLSDRYWEEVCPKCTRSGTIARLNTGELQCCYCNHKWRKVIHIGDDIKKNKSTLCNSCKRGFVEGGRCLSCGAKAKCCDKCGRSFKDKSQVQGLCDDCKDDVFFTCPVCDHEEPVSKADVSVCCSKCSKEYKVRVPVVSGDTSFEEDYDPNEAAFLRYREKESDIDDIINEVLDLTHQMGDTLAENKDPLEDMTELESAIERLAEYQRYIKDGNDSDESDDLWAEEDSLEQDRARWAAFDREHRRVKNDGDYNEVLITDAGDELLKEEVFDFHETKTKSRVSFNCPKCDGELDYEGFCFNCNNVLDCC